MNSKTKETEEFYQKQILKGSNRITEGAAGPWGTNSGCSTIIPQQNWKQPLFTGASLLQGEPAGTEGKTWACSHISVENSLAQLPLPNKGKKDKADAPQAFLQPHKAGKHH